MTAILLEDFGAVARLMERLQAVLADVSTDATAGGVGGRRGLAASAHGEPPGAAAEPWRRLREDVARFYGACFGRISSKGFPVQFRLPLQPLAEPACSQVSC